MLINEPSRTARAVAAVRLGAPRVPAEYGDPQAAERVERGVAAGVELPPDSHMTAYLVARTWFFDHVVVDAIDRGVTQIVTVATGYDTRALRYAKDGVRWFEVDHPATQGDKIRRVEALGTTADHLSFVTADFTVDDVAAELATAGCDPTKESLVLAEGIASYLTLPVLSSLLGGLRIAVGPASRLAISMSIMIDDPELAERRAAFKQRVAAAGEPIQSTLTAEESTDVLVAAGWRLDELSDIEGATGRTGLITATAV